MVWMQSIGLGMAMHGVRLATRLEGDRMKCSLVGRLDDDDDDDDPWRQTQKKRRR